MAFQEAVFLSLWPGFYNTFLKNFAEATAYGPANVIELPFSLSK